VLLAYPIRRRVGTHRYQSLLSRRELVQVWGTISTQVATSFHRPYSSHDPVQAAWLHGIAALEQEDG
jgi:hypothetical protein